MKPPNKKTKNPANNHYIIMGRFGSVYGVKGWIRAHSYTDPMTNLLDYPHLFVQHQNEWQALSITDGKQHGDALIVKLDGIDDRDEVRRHTNDYIAIPEEDLPKLQDGEYYWHDLVELEVLTTDNISLGHVSEVLATGSNDVLVVNDKRERLIPYTKEVVKSVDLDKKQITVDWDPEF